MTPNRTAPPVARRLAERPAAPPLPPVVLAGFTAAEERLPLMEETLLETLERTEERLELGNEEPERRAKSTCRKFKKGE